MDGCAGRIGRGKQRGSRWLSLALLAALAGCQKPADQGGQPAAGGGEAPKPAVAEKSEPANPARQLLEGMVAAYQNAKSYSDKGSVNLKGKYDGESVDQTQPFSACLVRPDRLRVEVYQTTLVINEGRMKASIAGIGNQYLDKPAPAKLEFRELLSDSILVQSLSRGFAGPPPQVIMMLEPRAVEALLAEADSMTVAGAETIDGRSYDRVKVSRKEGTSSYLIDRQTKVLRRLEYVAGDVADVNMPLKEMRLVADFAEAQFNGPVDAQRFTFVPPPGAEAVAELSMPAPPQLLGKKAPEFKFVGADKQPITPASLLGKVVVIDFWATWCGPCRQSLPVLEKVYQKYKGNSRVQFLAVSVDEAETSSEKVADALKELGVTIPLARDPDGFAGKAYFTTGIPTTFLLGADGVVQYCESGVNPNAEKEIPERVEQLLAGKNIFEEPLKRYQDEVRRAKQAAASASSGPTEDKSEPAGDTKQIEIPKATVAPKSDPQTFQLKPLWKSKDAPSPGNVVVYDDGKPHVLVVSNWHSCAEFDADGKLVATRSLELPGEELVAFIRTAMVDGKRYFAAFGPARQQVFIFDAQWKQLAKYPETGPESQHAGIADVQFVDFEGNGKPTLCVGYWGVVGVQGVSLEGKRLWANRQIQMALRLAEDSPDANGRRSLVSINMGPDNRCSLVTLDAKGERIAESPVADRMLQEIATADLMGDKHYKLVGRCMVEPGVFQAVGLSMLGRELWTYSLPKGAPAQPIEPLIAGRITRDGPGQWILPAADGSIHILSAEGKPIDKFNYGAALCGLATATLGGKPALVVATPEGVEAWEIAAK